MKIADKDMGFLRLLLRSPDVGEGWRDVSPPVWSQIVMHFPHQELIETRNAKQVRLSERGLTLVDYI